MGDTSKVGDLDGVSGGENGKVGDIGFSKVVHRAMEISSFLRISYEGNEKRLTDLLIVLEEGHCHVVIGSVSEPKGRMELKNLECFINFDARGDCSGRGKGRGFS